MVVVWHKAEEVDIYQELSRFFKITTCDVINVICFIEAIVNIVCPEFVIKDKKIVNKTKVVLFIKEDFSFINPSI